MGVTISPTEAAVIKATLEFANQKKITSSAQVQNIFNRLEMAAPGVVGFKAIPEKDFWAFRDNDQPELKGWLSEIAKDPSEARKMIGPQIDAAVQTVSTGIRFSGGRLIYGFVLDGVRAAYSFGVALILDSSRGITHKLNICDAPGCGAFRLDIKGKPKKYCNPAHYEAADSMKAAGRMRESRAREKKRTRKLSTKGG